MKFNFNIAFVPSTANPHACHRRLARAISRTGTPPRRSLNSCRQVTLAYPELDPGAISGRLLLDATSLIWQTSGVDVAVDDPDDFSREGEERAAAFAVRRAGRRGHLYPRRFHFL
jgi:hypothetical protein